MVVSCQRKRLVQGNIVWLAENDLFNFSLVFQEICAMYHAIRRAQYFPISRGNENTINYRRRRELQ